MNPGRIDQRGRFNLTGCVSRMSGSPGAARDSAAFVPLVLQIRCFGVCNRWAKNATIGIDRGTSDWVRDDARLAAPNTYGSFWDAANRGNRLVHARRTVVIANGASRQRRRGRNGSVRCSARNTGPFTIRTARTWSQVPLPKTLTSAEDSHERGRLSRAPGPSGLSIIDLEVHNENRLTLRGGVRNRKWT